MERTGTKKKISLACLKYHCAVGWQFEYCKCMRSALSCNPLFCKCLLPGHCCSRDLQRRPWVPASAACFRPRNWHPLRGEEGAAGAKAVQRSWKACLLLALGWSRFLRSPLSAGRGSGNHDLRVEPTAEDPARAGAGAVPRGERGGAKLSEQRGLPSLPAPSSIRRPGLVPGCSQPPLRGKRAVNN